MRNASQRRERIVRALICQGDLKVAALARTIGVSESTVRSDLSWLAGQGTVALSPGGALVLRPPEVDPSLEQDVQVPDSAAHRIGAIAATLVEAGDKLIIDSGSATLQMARHLGRCERVTVMTNGLGIARELIDAPGIDLMLTGGQVHGDKLAIQGLQAEGCLQGYGFDKLFLDVGALNLQFGVSTHREAEADLKQRMVRQAEKVYLLADASKFGRVSLHRVTQLHRVHAVISDAGLAEEYRVGLDRIGVPLMLAD